MEVSLALRSTLSEDVDADNDDDDDDDDELAPTRAEEEVEETGAETEAEAEAEAVCGTDVESDGASSASELSVIIFTFSKSRAKLACVACLPARLSVQDQQGIVSVSTLDSRLGTGTRTLGTAADRRQKSTQKSTRTYIYLVHCRTALDQPSARCM